MIKMKVNYFRSSLGIFFTNVILYPISIVNGILIARYLGPGGKGIFAYMGLITNFILPIFMFGYFAGVLYYVSSEKVSVTDYGFTIAIVSILLGLFSAVILWFLWKFHLLGKTASALPSDVFYTILFFLPFSSLNLSWSKVIAGLGWFSLNNLLSIYRKALFLLLIMILIYKESINIENVIYAYIISAISSLLISLVAVNIKYRIGFTFHINKTILKMLNYGVKSMMGSLANKMNARMDQFFLSVFARSSELGLYSVAVSISEILWIIPSSIGPVLFKKIAVTRSKHEKFVIINKIHRTIMWGMIILSGFLFILSIYLIPVLYGEKFKPSIKILAIYLPGSTIFISRRIIVRYFGASGMPLKQSIDQIVGAIVGLISFLILVPHFKIYGAAAGSSLAYLSSVLFVWYLYKREASGFNWNLFKLKKEDVIWLIKNFKSLIVGIKI